MELTTITTLISIGVLVSLLSTLLGIGGGIIAIPLLFSFIKNLPPTTAAGTMLCIIGINCSVNCYNYYRTQLTPKLSHVIPLLLAISLGAIIGSNIGVAIAPRTFKLMFVLLLFTTSFKNMFIKISAGSENSNWAPPESVKKRSLAISFIFLGGILSGLSGIGGGIIIIPTLLLLYSPPVKIVPIYSNYIMALGSIMGGISYFFAPLPNNIPIMAKFQIGQVNLGIMAFILIGAIITSKIGITLGQKIPQKIGKFLFSLALIAMAIKIILSL